MRVVLIVYVKLRVFLEGLFLEEDIMPDKRAFTLIELMVVVLILSILAAVSIPIYVGRVDSAVCSEGKALAGDLARAIRLYGSEKGPAGGYGADSPSLLQLGVSPGELTGAYFHADDFSWSTTYTAGSDPALTFEITVDTPERVNTLSGLTLDSDGVWGDIH